MIKAHPDRGGDANTFHLLQKSYRFLIGEEEEDVEASTVENWSGTKRVECERVFSPESVEALERAVKSGKYRKLRPMGSALSPNGCAFESSILLQSVASSCWSGCSAACSSGSLASCSARRSP